MSSKVTFPGHELRERREERGISLTEAYKRVHIPIRYIQALETSDIETLPEPCFVKGFLKSYCAYLELNADRFVNLYHEAAGAAYSRTLPQKPKERVATPEWRTELVTWATICAVLAVVWLGYQAVVRPDAGPNDGRVEAGAPDIHERPATQGNPFEPQDIRQEGF